MSHTCTPILVGVFSPVLKILLLSKMAKFPFLTRHVHAYQFLRRYGYLSKTAKFPFQGMDYSPWSSKNLIDRNRLKKFMHVGLDVKCMHTDFGGRGLSSFGDMATFKKQPNFPFGHGL